MTLTNIDSLTVNVKDGLLGDSGIQTLSESLMKLKQLTKLNLNVENNKIGINGIIALSKSI